MAYSFFCNEILNDNDQEKCIKVNDTYTELFLYFFINVLKDKKGINPWFDNFLLKEYVEQSQGKYSSYMSLSLTDLFLDKDKMTIYKQLLKEVREIVISQGDLIAPEFGNLYVNLYYQSKYVKPIKSIIIIDLIDHISWILGDVEKKPSQRFNTKISNDNNKN